MAKVFRWRYAWRRAGRQARFGECTVVEQIEVHEDGSTEVVGFEIRGAGSDSTWLYGADEVELLKELISKRRTRESRARVPVAVSRFPADEASNWTKSAHVAFGN